MLRGSCSIYPVPTELRGALLPASRRPKASLMPADRVPLEDYAVAHDGFAEEAVARKFKGPTVTSLV